MPVATPASAPSERKSRLQRRQGGAWLMLGIFVLFGVLTRATLLVKAASEVSWNITLLSTFAWGLAFDTMAALLWVAPFSLLLAMLPARFFAWRAARWAAWAFFLALFYGLFFTAVAEWFFWDEFGVRFNFIAVDYLVYTKEVVGNIRESYPMPWIYAGIFVASALGLAALHATGWVNRWLAAAEETKRARWTGAARWCGAALIAALVVNQEMLPEFANAYHRELAKNGVWSLFAAFRANQLEYERFYPTLPHTEAFTRVHRLMSSDGALMLSKQEDLLRYVEHRGPEVHMNVIQITVESLSADFLSSFNRATHLTPNLDTLARQSLLFDHFYATGTRTDRGMEALTLSVPPTPGRSLVKRPNNEHLFTLGSVFRTRGYETAFIYGGFGYFDNMNYFFGENGYRVVDRTKVPSGDITFSNVWGACDEDLFRWTMREADRDAAQGKPFFYFVMTTSNHRPFTYPDGKIDLPSKISGRSGGVKYSDYAIGEFFRQAQSKPWFKNTIFVIVGDHCASSAGKTELPVQNYHIPLLIYTPGGQIQPGVVHTPASQIDYAPTLLGLLRWSYPTRFFGRDVLALDPDVPGRALIGNYQKLGLLRGDRLEVLKPVRHSNTFRYDEARQELQPLEDDAELRSDAISYYQVASWLFAHGRQRELSAAELKAAHEAYEEATAPRFTLR